MADTEPKPGEDEQQFLGRRMLEQAFELWINPEIARRESNGTLPADFALYMAQQVQKPDGTTVVRFNDEVRGIAQVRTKRDVDAGDPVYLNDFDAIQNFDLADEELDSTHWTVIRTAGSWFTSFNFLPLRGRCRDLLEKALQFAEAAAVAKGKGQPSVGVDTLFSACELTAKAELVSSHMLSIETRTHSPVASEINKWRKLGNIEGAFVDLFNRLNQLRPRYRYDASFSDPTPVTLEDLELVDAIIRRGIRRLAPTRGPGSVDENDIGPGS